MLNKIATEYSRDWTIGECKRELGQARGGSGLRLPYLCARLAAWGSLQQRTAGLRRLADPVLAAARRRAPSIEPLRHAPRCERFNPLPDAPRFHAKRKSFRSTTPQANRRAILLGEGRYNKRTSNLQAENELREVRWRIPGLDNLHALVGPPGS